MLKPFKHVLETIIYVKAQLFSPWKIINKIIKSKNVK